MECAAGVVARSASCGNGGHAARLGEGGSGSAQNPQPKDIKGQPA
jgi:hypothetical protein